MRRVVLDTSVLVAAFRSRGGASWRLVDHIAEGRLAPLATPALFLEYEAVLKRPEQLAATGLSVDDVDRLLSALASAIEPVMVHFMWRPQLSDSNDEMVLEAAVNGRADALITFNLRDFAGAARKFDLRVLRPGEALREHIG
jgi:putative PIN family toxin of toxin-antitoxin system